MRITHLDVRNWRNFKLIDVPVGERLFVLGPNASGKSNFFDSLRFLHDIVADGGGLAAAMDRRGGMSRVRNLAARNYNKGLVKLSMTLGTADEPSAWTYELQLGGTGGVVRSERVWKGEDQQSVLSRPNDEDRDDPERLTQTALEQVNSNKEFRPVADYLRALKYVNPAPQMIREAQPLATGSAEFGQDLIRTIAQTNKREQGRRLKAINRALAQAVPQLSELKIEKDDDGRPHLVAGYEHWRGKKAWQDESDFSDGTLRLIAILWALMERREGGLTLLLEEPEISLHEELVQQLPRIFWKISKSTEAQVIVTTHARSLLEEESGLGADEIMLLEPSSEGTNASIAGERAEVMAALRSQISLGEILHDELSPKQLRLFGDRFLQ
ncbi:MAG: AAA family ATPase [Planctomycetota bacterium]